MLNQPWCGGCVRLSRVCVARPQRARLRCQAHGAPGWTGMETINIETNTQLKAKLSHIFITVFYIDVEDFFNIGT